MARLLLAAALAFVVGCADRERAEAIGEYGQTTPPSVAAPNGDRSTCADGEERACRAFHGADCFEGVQRCSAGAWGVCSSPSARALSCTFDSIDVPNLKLTSELALEGAPRVRLSQRGGASKVTIGTEMFDLGVAANGDLELAERAASFKLQLSSVEVSIVSVAVTGKLTADCTRIESLTVSLTTPSKSSLIFQSLPEGL